MSAFAIPLETRWSDRLAFDIALRLENSGDDITDILARHGINNQDLLVHGRDPLFVRRVEHYRTEIRDKGLTFRLKARAQAEELLRTSWLLIHHPDVSPAVKADLIKSTVKWGGLEPKDTGGQVDGGGVRITINLGGSDATPTVVSANVIEHDPAQAAE